MCPAGVGQREREREQQSVGSGLHRRAPPCGCIRSGLQPSRDVERYEQYRANLGRGILLGLEFLIGADIIATVTSPLTWESVGLLGAVVLIRTVLSFSLETEIEGVAPWRRRETERDSARDDR